MQDVKTPRPKQIPLTPNALSVLAKWLAAKGLSDLTGAIVNADRHDTWTLHKDLDALHSDIGQLYAALSDPVNKPNGVPHSRSLIADLTYILAYLRTSNSVHVLSLLSTRWPGIIDQLLRESAVPSHGSDIRVESAVFLKRMSYLIRHHAAPQIFSSERLAEVKMAIAAAQIARRNA